MSVTYMTRQQRAVLEGVKASPEGCATAAELTEQLHREGQTIGLTTVYRQLERLAQQGLVHKAVTDQGAYYQYCGHDEGSCFLLKCEKMRLHPASGLLPSGGAVPASGAGAPLPHRPTADAVLRSVRELRQGGERMKRLFALLLALTLAVSLVGCGPRQRAEDGKLQVVCTVFPYYDFARQIGGDDVDVTLLVAAGKETHSFEPTPLDVITLSESDVFLYNGGESEAWVEDILSAAGENIAVTLPLMPQVSALAEEWAEGMEGGHDDHDHDHDSEDHSHDSDDIEYDEHVWTSPVLAKTLCQAICDALCQADPAHQEGYQSRLTDYLAQLDQLDEAFRDMVAAGQRRLLVFGDRFPLLYFCKEYGLDYRAAFHGCASDTEPSLATLKYLIDKVEEAHIPVVYTIELSSRKVAQAIAETTGAKVLTFQSCQTVSRQDMEAGATYLSLMWENVEALKEGLA